MTFSATDSVTDASVERFVAILLHFSRSVRGEIAGELEALGYSVRSIADLQALRLADTSGCDVVVMMIDQATPSELRLFEDIRGLPTFQSLPFIILTERGDEAAAGRFVERGAVAVLDRNAGISFLSGWMNGQKFMEAGTSLMRQLVNEKRRAGAFEKLLIPVSLALFAEKDFGRLLETILIEAKTFCHADGGTLYLRTPEDTLQFMMLHSTSLGISEGGVHGPVTHLAPLKLYREEDGRPNNQYVATHVYHAGKTVNIPDVYKCRDFDFSGARASDAKLGYRTTSVLAIPLQSENAKPLGVLQLLNAQDPETGRVVPFDSFLQWTAESLAKLAGVGLESYKSAAKLREELQALHLVVDETRKREQVSRITESHDFQALKEKARLLKEKAQKTRKEGGS
jgi:GAF domain-containing protein